MARTVVLGCGGSLPPRTVGNDTLAGSLGVDAEGIARRTGVTTRHWVEPGVGPSDLAREASERALAQAGLAASDVDFIVFATMTPDIAFPGSGCLLQRKLGPSTTPALDVRAQCAGFVFALVTADRLLQAGMAQRVLVAGGDVHSTALDVSPRGATATPWFGDGAGVVLLGRGGDTGGEPGLLAQVLHSDPDRYQRFWCEFPSSRNYPARMELSHLHEGRHYYVVDAEGLAEQAERTLVETIAHLLAQAGVGPDAPALTIVHYLDPRVARRAAARAGIAEGRVVAPAEVFGHVAAGGIPIALAQAIDAGRVGRGDLVCCVAFGAGLCWGGALLRL